MPENAAPPPFDPAAFEDLVEHIPALVAIRTFAAETARIAWLKHAGAPLSPAITDLSQRFLDGLGFPQIALARIETWSDAAAAAESLDWNDPAWEAEEQLSAALTVEALDVMGEEALSVALTYVQGRVGTGLFDNVADNAAWEEISDEQLINAAAGAILRACHSQTLICCAHAELPHPLDFKFQLFKAGRWPIGVAGSTFNLF